MKVTANMKRGGLYALIGAISILLPLLTGKFSTHLLTTYLIYSLVALSLDVMWGYTGILSIGHFAFFGVGAYAASLILTRVPAGVPGLALAALGGVGLATVFAFVVAMIFFTLRLGDLFVLVTISLAIVLEKIAVDQTQLLGGINGITLPYWVVPENKILFFYLMVGVVLVLYLLLRRVVDSPFGKVLAAIKDQERRAQYLGYDTRTFKAVVFAMSAGVAGLAGVLHAVYTGFVSPPLFGFSLSFDAVIWTAIGGLGTLFGPIVGTFVVGLAQFYISGLLLDYWILVIGLLFIIVVIFLPRGLTGIGMAVAGRIGLRQPVPAVSVLPLGDHSAPEPPR